MEISIKRFNELTVEELYDIISIREDIFVVEQTCIYLECDGKDKQAYHMIGREEGKIVSYLRILDPGVQCESVAIGRVLSVIRRKGYASILLQEAISFIQKNYDCHRIELEAQVYASSLYSALGFVQISDEFLEDGIPHIKMEYIYD